MNREAAPELIIRGQAADAKNSNYEIASTLIDAERI